MKKLFILFAATFLLMSCSNPTTFTEESKTEKLVTLSGKEITFKEILDKHKGKKIVLDVWASWCKDCIVRLPNLKQLQKDFPNVSFVFLSHDRTPQSWKRGIQRFGIVGDHYLMPEKMDGPLADFLNLWWIPRYVVIDEQQNITLFKATKITDSKIVKALKN